MWPARTLNIVNPLEKAQMRFFKQWASGPLTRCTRCCVDYERFSEGRLGGFLRRDTPQS